MLDFRVKKPAGTLNWRYQEILVTEDYLIEHADDPSLITLDDPYELGKKVLDVYVNGHRLTEGVGYEEVDDLHIRLSVPPEVGDEIVIKEWYNSDSFFYSPTGINSRLTAVEVEVRNARNYTDEELIFPDLRSRLNFMQDEIDQLKVSSPAIEELTQRVEDIETELEAARDTFPDLDSRLTYIQELAEQGGGGIGGGSDLSVINTTVTYITDDYGNVVREEVTGDLEYVKDYVYNEDFNLVQEKITIEGQTYTRNYYYDSDGYLVGEDGEKIEFISSLSKKALKDIGYLLGEGNYDVEFTYNNDGKIIREEVTGDYAVVKEYTYNEHGKIHTETITYGNKVITKTFRYNEQGKVSGFSCVTTTT